MNTRTPLARVEGLGAAHSGVGHFWRQRVTAAALAPLAIWFACSALALIGATRSEAIAFLKVPFNAVMMALFIVATAIHMSLGVQMVIEDYIHRDGSKITLLVLNQFFAWIIAATALFALIKIVL